MSRWFRHYAGMMRDDKLVRVAIRSKQTIERVVWIYGAILESAAEIDDEGRYDLDAAEVAYFLRADESDVDAVLRALADAGRVAENRVVAWSNRQFQSDRSAPRVAAHRERKRQEKAGSDGEKDAGNGVVTLQPEPCNAPETETETETEDSEPIGSVAPRRFPIKEAVEFYNANATHCGWPTVSKLNEGRERDLRNRLREHGIEGWKAAITRARASPFLGGTDPPRWFHFDFLLNSRKFLKTLEGNYDRNHNDQSDPTSAALRAAIGRAHH